MVNSIVGICVGTSRY